MTTTLSPFEGKTLTFPAGKRTVKLPLDKPRGLNPDARIAFKVRTNNFYRFSIVPNTGYLPCEVTVAIKPKPHRARKTDMLQVLTLVRREGASDDLGTIHKSNWRKVAHKQLINIRDSEENKAPPKSSFPLPLQFAALMAGAVACFVYSALLQEQLRAVLGNSNAPLDRGVLCLLLLTQCVVNAAVAWVSLRLQPQAVHKALSSPPANLPPRPRKVSRIMAQPVRPLAALWRWCGGVGGADWFSGMTWAASLALWGLVAMLTGHWALHFVGQRMQSFARSSLVLLVALAEVVVVQANHTFGRLLSAALVSTGAVVFYWAKPEAIYPGDWIGRHSGGMSVEGVALFTAPVVLSTLVASTHQLLESQFRLGWARTMLIANQWMFLYFVIGIALSGQPMAIAELIRAWRVTGLWWLCGAVEQVCLFLLLCGPTGALGMSAVFVLRQPCAAVVSTAVPLSAQWTGVRVTPTQWVGVLLLAAVAVAETIAYYRRLGGHAAGPGSGRTVKTISRAPSNVFLTPRPKDREDSKEEERHDEAETPTHNETKTDASETKKYD